MENKLDYFRKKFNKEMNFIRLTVILSLFIVFISGCKKDEKVFETVHPVVNNDPVQYDVPFNKVPETSDIAIYEVNLRAFSSAGNLSGVKAGLDSIKGLGINVVWLMPIYPIGELKGVGSPYCVKNYTQVNSAYGTLDDLRSLVKEAHNRNMAVILDWVANHTAWDNAWIQNKSWYTQDASGNIISPDGWADVADLNYSNTAMRAEMIKAMKYWTLTANIDGYRCDYAEGVPTDFWKQAIDTLRKIPNRKIIMFAEARSKNLFTSGFNLTFGWDFYAKLKDVFNNDAAASGLVSVNEADYSNVPQGSQILRWITNHDDNSNDNTPITIFKGNAGSMAAFVLTSYMGGVPLIYNGQEVGCPIKLSFFSNGTTKIDWTINPEMHQEYKKLMAFRNGSNAVKNGSIETYNTSDIMAFKRISGSEEVLVIVNVRNSAIDFQLPASIAGTSWKDALSGTSIQLNNSLSINPFAYIILKK
ncbi:MAG TPA: alpha-amylase family glycosyl hydrolase [Prolixibacteraceae bacterium]|nr:alpha-amylase family glycosyl hydrolase [Prolixibacteraceae bacterium]